ncbi:MULTISPECIES: LuxR C-terminal-related transcriptional regulator [unclassified Pseudomonas]|uniref:LuxR C-terminal-related transcriptional regulator n=1 Tax=unclassified Pseudomonas TaxID=196821 RepID=UPI00069F6F08|nr:MULTISPECIES: LuxR C-terminal-related transcriptional regulator [unclassified Pseudomonas]WPN44776.1 LuxR C-terminal-related transcriptional regulator [Pseudomonas sp. P8_241]
MKTACDLLALGRFDAARRRLSQVIGHAAQHGTGGVPPAATAMESLIDLTQGGLASARMRLECFVPDCTALAGLLPNVMRALVLYESGSLDQAQDLLARTQPHIPDDSPPDALIVSHILMARIAYSRGEGAICRRHLATLMQAAHDRACRRSQCSVWIERARMATLEGRVLAAAQALTHVDRYGDWARSQAFYYANDVDTPTVARVRLYIAQGRFDLALRTLRPEIAQAHGQGRLRRKLKLRLLLAVALEGSAQHEAAMAELTGLLPFASEEGWRSTFVEEGACLEALLQRCARTLRARGGEPGFIGDLLKRLAGAPGLPSDVGQACSVLTEREQQVVRLVAQGYPISAIADNLRLSGYTVKVHLRNLFRKLGAHGQTQAAAIARARGLLDCLEDAPHVLCHTNTPVALARITA